MDQRSRQSTLPPMRIPQHYPAPVRDALTRLHEELAVAVSPSPTLAVYGSLAKGTFRESESDVNVVIVLEDADARALRAMAPATKRAFRSVRMQPFILERREIGRLADAFPIKIRDIIENHDLLVGADPFEGVAVDNADLRLRVEQELRNQQVRLRRQAVFGADDERQLGAAIYHAISTLGLELWALLILAGKSPAGSTLDVVAELAVDAFDLDAGTLERLVAIKAGGDIEDAGALFESLSTLVGRLVTIADRIEVAP